MDVNLSPDQFDEWLLCLSSKSRLAKHWISNLINPVFLMMLYIRAEREADFSLHLYASKEMLPYFFAAGHWNYARDGVAYVRMMENLPVGLLVGFLNGEHVIHLQKGWWNGIWTDMAIETSYMKLGKGPTGVIGITTNEKALKVWANGHHLCGEVLTELSSLRGETNSPVLKHKEVYPGRIQADNKDHENVQTAMGRVIHPLKLDTHSSNKLLNIYTGEDTDGNVNVDDAVDIGTKEMKHFKNKLPEGFRDRLSTKVKTMSAKKGRKISTA